MANMKTLLIILFFFFSAPVIAQKGRGAVRRYSDSSAVQCDSGAGVSMKEQRGTAPKRKGGPPPGVKRGSHSGKKDHGEGPPRERMMSLATPMTLEVLAYKHRTSVKRLKKLNASIREYNPADTIRLPRLIVPILRIRESYGVQRGDTWKSVAQKHKVNENALRRVNEPFISGELEPGQTLFLPDPPDLRWLWVALLLLILTTGALFVKKLVIRKE